MKNAIYAEILKYINTLEIIDTHEHLPSWENQREKTGDFLTEYLSHYLSSDLISSGLSQDDYKKVMNSALPILERWKIVEPYWENCRYTGYARAVLLSLKDLHGFDDIDSNNIIEINEKFKKTFKPGYFRYVLKEKSKIKISILDKWDNKDFDPGLFVQAVHINELILPQNTETFLEFKSKAKMSVNSFDDWISLTKEYLVNKCLSGIKVFKCSLAYERSIDFDNPEKNLAEAEFKSVWKQINKSINNLDLTEQQIMETKNFQDYMMHIILTIASEFKITVQFHTGLQEGNGNYLSNSNPLLLTKLFMKYPEVDFDLFHISYPYYKIAGVLAKNFPNVYLDMCWSHIISPNASVNALLEWIDTVPINKISAFGGDYLFVDGVYGHQVMARANVSKVLALKTEDGIFSIEEAKKIAKMFFYDNPRRIFKLDL